MLPCHCKKIHLTPCPSDIPLDRGISLRLGLFSSCISVWHRPQTVSSPRPHGQPFWRERYVCLYLFNQLRETRDRLFCEFHAGFFWSAESMIIDTFCAAGFCSRQARETVFDHETVCDRDFEHFGTGEPDFGIGFVVSETIWSDDSVRIEIFIINPCMRFRNSTLSLRKKGTVCQKIFLDSYFFQNPLDAWTSWIWTDGDFDASILAVFEKRYERRIEFEIVVHELHLKRMNMFSESLHIQIKCVFGFQYLTDLLERFCEIPIVSKILFHNPYLSFTKKIPHNLSKYWCRMSDHTVEIKENSAVF